MAVSATATLVSTFTGDAARPAGHAGWNNPVGDPTWVPDIDWYRRVQLTCTGSAGEVGGVVNWEILDSSQVVSKTSAEIAATTAGTTASPFGALVNNTTTWTLWATTGSAAAAAAKYTNTGTPCISTLRANNAIVQVVLGNKKKIGDSNTTFTVGAFLPGAGKVPNATASITIGVPITASDAIEAPAPEEDAPEEETPEEEAPEEDFSEEDAPEDSTPEPEPAATLDEESPETEIVYGGGEEDDVPLPPEPEAPKTKRPYRRKGRP